MNLRHYQTEDRSFSSILIWNSCNIFWNRQVLASKNMMYIASEIQAINERPVFFYRHYRKGLYFISISNTVWFKNVKTVNTIITCREGIVSFFEKKIHTPHFLRVSKLCCQKTLYFCFPHPSFFFIFSPTLYLSLSLARLYFYICINGSTVTQSPFFSKER